MSRIAYLVQAHNNPILLERLIARLSPYSDVYVHLDSKTDISAFAACMAYPNTVFVEDRKSVYWAGVSQIDGTVSTMQAALASGVEYARLVLISGMCYPMAEVPAINEWFAREPEREIIRWIDMRESEHYMSHLNKSWFREPIIEFSHPKLRTLDKGVGFILRRLPIPNPSPWRQEMVPCFGSNWWALSSKCCRYILDFLAANPWYREMNAATFAVDEHYFHTIVANSPFAERADGLRKFTHVSTSYLTNFHHIDPFLVKWFTIDDWDELAASGRLFIRKVRTQDGMSLCDRLDREPMAIAASFYPEEG
jgi:hypothetical protein